MRARDYAYAIPARPIIRKVGEGEKLVPSWILMGLSDRRSVFVGQRKSRYNSLGARVLALFLPSLPLSIDSVPGPLFRLITTYFGNRFQTASPVSPPSRDLFPLARRFYRTEKERHDSERERERIEETIFWFERILRIIGPIYTYLNNRARGCRYVSIYGRGSR